MATPAKVPKGAVFGARFSEDNEMYRVGTVAKQEDQQYLVQFIDFGNKEAKPKAELFLLPEDLAGEPSAAIAIQIDTGLEDTEENRKDVDALLAQNTLSVTIENGKGQFFSNGQPVFPVPVQEEEVSKAKEAEPPISSQTQVQEPSTLESIVTTAPKNATAPTKERKQNPDFVQPTKVLKEETVAASPSSTQIPAKDSIAENHEGSPLATPLKPADMKVDTKSKNQGKQTQENSCPPSKPAAVEKPKVNVSDSQCFVKAVKDIQTKPAPRKRPELNQDKARRNMPVGCSGDEAMELPWRQGEAVVVKCSDDVWREAKIIASKMSRVFVSTSDDSTVWVEIKNVRSSSVPAEALNKIDKDINSNTLIRETGDGADLETGDVLSQAVDKVKNWMEKNANNQDIAPRFYGETSKASQMSISKKLPEGSKLVDYCRTRSGSEHVQSVLNTSNVQLAR